MFRVTWQEENPKILTTDHPPGPRTSPEVIKEIIQELKRRVSPMHEDVCCEEKSCLSSNEVALLVVSDSQTRLPRTAAAANATGDRRTYRRSLAPGDIPFLVIARHCRRHHQWAGVAHPSSFQLSVTIMRTHGLVLIHACIKHCYGVQLTQSRNLWSGMRSDLEVRLARLES